MRSTRNISVLLPLLLSALFFASTVQASSVPSRPSNYVVDLADIINQSIEARLNGFLMELEQKTGAQVVLLSVESLEGNSIEDFSLAVAEQWGLGRKGKDDGMLIFFAMKEKRYRFEVGYGLEGILPDSLVGSIGRDYIVPYFKKGEYSNGAAAAVLAVAGIIAKDSGVEITGMPPLGRPQGRTGRTSVSREPTLAGVIFTILFAVFIVYMFIRHPRLMLMMILCIVW